MGSFDILRRGRAPVTNRGAACFTWDDGYSDVLTVATLHQTRGQRITVGITKNLIGTANHISESEAQSLAVAGHELAAHSVTHSNFVTSLTAAERSAEYDESKEYCETLSGRDCTTWIYPYGGAARDSTTDQELLVDRFDRFADTGVVGNLTAYNARHPHFPPRHIVRQNLDGTAANQAASLALIRLAGHGQIIPVFYCHQLDEANAPTTAQYTALLDECMDRGLAVLPMDEVFPAPPNLRDPGFEEADISTLWSVVLSGDGAAESVADTPDSGLSGSRSLHLSCTTGFAYVTQTLPVMAGEAYTFSGRYRTSAGLGNSTLSMRARQFRFDATQIIGANLGGAVNESTTWTRFEKDMTADAEAAYWSVDVLLQPGAAGEAWVDHLDFGSSLFGSYG